VHDERVDNVGRELPADVVTAGLPAGTPNRTPITVSPEAGQIARRPSN
jgi:hypothetical protein